MRRISSGFTIVEMIIVIVVIGILTIVGVSSYFQILAGARDSQTAAKVASLAEALEGYYSENGEYPSCDDMTQSISVVASEVLPSISADSLTSPNATTGTNSIICIIPTYTNQIAYIGDGATSADANSTFSIQYIEEYTGDSKSVASRH